jgi:hypothetical protein
LSTLLLCLILIFHLLLLFFPKIRLRVRQVRRDETFVQTDVRVIFRMQVTAVNVAVAIFNIAITATTIAIALPALASHICIPRCRFVRVPTCVSIVTVIITVAGLTHSCFGCDCYRFCARVSYRAQRAQRTQRAWRFALVGSLRERCTWPLLL